MRRAYKKNGFTLIEAIIASGIILFGVVSIISLTLTSHIAGVAISEEYRATELAQEVIEAVRVVRDSNWEQQQTDSAHAWDAGLAGSQNDHTAIFALFDSTHEPQDDVFVFSGCNDINDDCAAIMENDSVSVPFFQKKISSIAFGERTPFSRLVTLTPLCRDSSGNETLGDICPNGTALVGYDVVVEVSWSSRTGKQKVVLEEYIYDWQ